MKEGYHKLQRDQLHRVREFRMSGLKNGTSYHDSDTFVEPWNFKDAVQIRTVVLAVEMDEPQAMKVRECGVNKAQFNFSNFSVTFNIFN